MRRLILLAITFCMFACVHRQDLSETAGPPSIPPPKQVSAAEITAGTETKLRSYSPANIVSLIDTHSTSGVEAGAFDFTTWNGNTNAGTKDAIRDQFFVYDTDGDGYIDNIAGSVGGGDITGVGPGGTGAGDALTDGYLTSGTTLFIWEGTTSDANQVNFVMPEADPSAATTLTFPDQTGTFLLGPAAGLTDNTIPRSDGSTSHLLQASGITIDDSDNLANVGTISSGAITSTGTSTFGTAASPDAADGATLGSATAEWSDLFLADGGVIYGQSDQSNSITSSATDWTFALDVVVTGSDLTLGAAGVKLTGDGDGAITFLGLGDGADEDLTINLDDTANTAVISSSTGVTGITFTSIGLTTGAASDLSAGAVTVGTLSGTITMASATDVTYKDGTVDPADLADADFGDFTVSSGSATLDADTVAAAEMADADHGDVSWTSGVAAVEDLTITSEAQGDILYFNGTNWVRLAPGVSGQYLQTQGAAANPQWASTGVSGDIEDVGDASSGAVFTADGAGNTLYFEGSTANAFEVILTADDATADVTATLTLDTGNIIIGASDFTTDTALVRVDRDSAEYASIEETGILVDASNNMSAVGTLGITGDLTMATADPDIVLDDTDGADGLIQIAAADADDSVMTLAVDDSGGDDQGYIELDGVNETVDILQNATFSGTVTVTGTLTVNGASATLPATSFGDANITNVGSLALDSIIADSAAIVIGGGTETLAINTSDWDIGTDGAITGASFDANGTGNSITNINAADHADEDWGDFSVATGAFTLDADVVAAAEMADADHGDVSWTSGVATVEDFTLTGDASVPDDIAIIWGTNSDWDVSYDETTDDRFEFVHAAGAGADVYWDLNDNAADSTYTVTNSDGTYEANLSVEGDISAGGALTVGGDGSSYITFTNNTSYAGSGYQLFYKGGNLITTEAGTEKTVLNATDGATLTGTSWDFGAVTNFEIPNGNSATADAEGELAIDTDDEQFKMYINATAITMDFSGDTNGYVLKSNGSGTFTLQADATGGTPTIDSVGDATGDATIAFDAGEEMSWQFTGAYTTGTQFLVQQQTGNPTGGVLFEARGADSDSVVAKFGDGTNAWTVSTAGLLTNAGTATLNFAAASDLTIGGGQIDFDDMAGAGNISTSGTIAGNGVNPDAADGAALGTPALEWSDIYLADGGVIYFQNDQSVYLTPSASTLTLTGKMAATAGMDVGTSQAITGTTAVTLGDNNQTWAVNSSDWDINATGDMTGIGSITSGGAISVSLADAELVTIDGANDTETMVTFSLNAADLTGDTTALLITAVDNDDANYIPLLIQDDQDGTPDDLFKVDYQGIATAAGGFVGNLTGNVTNWIYSASDCSSTADGFCRDTDDDYLYYYANSALVLTILPTGKLVYPKESGVAGSFGLYEANSTDLDTAGEVGPASMTANSSYRGQYPNAGPTLANSILAWNGAGESGTGTPADPYVFPRSWIVPLLEADIDTVAELEAILTDAGAYASDILAAADAAALTALLSAASDSVSGRVELATAAETTTGTDATRAVTPDALAGSTYGTVFILLRAHEYGTTLTVADGKDYFVVPPELNGWNLVSVFGSVGTASSSGTPTFNVYNVTDSQDMLSTALTIDASEKNSSTAATPAVINGTYDDVATGDEIRLDCDVAGTGTTGGDVLLGFRLP